MFPALACTKRTSKTWRTTIPSQTARPCGFAPQGGTPAAKSPDGSSSDLSRRRPSLVISWQRTIFRVQNWLPLVDALRTTLLTPPPEVALFLVCTATALKPSRALAASRGAGRRLAWQRFLRCGFHCGIRTPLGDYEHAAAHAVQGGSHLIDARPDLAGI